MSSIKGKGKVLALSIGLFAIMSACGGEETPQDFGKSVFTAITKQDTTALLDHRLTEEDAAIVAEALNNRSDYQGLNRRLGKYAKEDKFISESPIDGFSLDKWKSHGIVDIVFDSVVLSEFVPFSERVQYYHDSHIFVTLVDTAGQRNGWPIRMTRIFTIDGKIKIADW
jgi:hypothetical protein